MIESEFEIICPHCQFPIEEWYEYVNPSDMDGQFEEDCSECGKHFLVEFNTYIIFKTMKHTEGE
jgi:nitrate/TMAO reductase-like tetraheme cytochrome c subunit